MAVPAAISVVASGAGRASFLLLLNIRELLRSKRVVPGEFLIDATDVAAGFGFDTDTVGGEVLRQHHGAGDLLEILERKRQPGGILVRRHVTPRQRDQL